MTDIPRANFLYDPVRPGVAEPVRFVDVTQGVPAGETAARSWRFGDGGKAGGLTPTHAFGRPGDYRVELRVATPEGATSMVVRTVRVR